MNDQNKKTAEDQPVEDKPTMKIVRLTEENIKNITALEIEPDGAAVIIEGANEAGKSAVLDGIEWVLTGKGSDGLVRRGQNVAEVSLDLGYYKVRRVALPKGYRLEVTSSTGVQFPSPQALLNKIKGDLSFDPLAFKDLKPDEQSKMLLRAAGVNVEEDEKARKEIYDERTVVNRQVKSLKSQFQAMPLPANETPDEEESLSVLVDKLRILDQRQAKVREWEAERERFESYRKDAEFAVEEFDKKLQQAKQALVEFNGKISEHQEEMPDLTPSDKEVNDVKQRVGQVEHINKLVRAKKQRVEFSKQLALVEAESKDFDRQLAVIDANGVDKISHAEFGIDGLTVDQTGIYLDGISFQQLATSRKIRVSTAIAMSLNPTLKVLLVREGSLLDENSLAELIKQVGDNGYQIWIECVKTEQGVGVFIQDGAIVAPDGKVVNK